MGGECAWIRATSGKLLWSGIVSIGGLAVKKGGDVVEDGGMGGRREESCFHRQRKGSINRSLGNRVGVMRPFG